MKISMDRMGRVVQVGEGSFRVPVGVEQTDNTLSAPASQAEALWEQDRAEYATLAANQSRAEEARMREEAFRDSLRAQAEDFQNFMKEAAESVNAGEHPLTWVAALQSMAGNSHEHYCPINGYMLSQDGVPAFDRTMSGESPLRSGRMGDLMSDLQSFATQTQAVVNQGASITEAMMNMTQAPTQTSYTPPTSTVTVPNLPGQSGGKWWSDKKVAIPLCLAAALGVYLIAKKK